MATTPNQQKPQTGIASGGSRARIMFLSLPILAGVCLVLAYLLRRGFGLDYAVSVYAAALPALAVSLVLSAALVRRQDRRRDQRRAAKSGKA